MGGQDRPTALIAGGGIAGMGTAIALQHAGMEPVIYEARAAASDRAGAFLTIATNGIDALRALGADSPVLKRGFATPTIVLRSASGKMLGRVATGVAMADGTESHTLKRADLYAALTDETLARGVRIEYGKKLVDARCDGTSVTAVFADGSEAVGAMLVGADGVHSAVRRIVDPAVPDPHYEGLTSIAGYVRDVAVPAPAGRYEMIFGRRAFFGYVPAPTGEVWWFANLPQREEPSTPERHGSDAPVVRARLIEAFAEDAGPARELVDATSELTGLTPLHTVPRLSRWHRGPIVLIGDAAHAPSPTSGQGASLSIEDGAELAWAIRHSDTIVEALSRFEADRRRRVERIVRWASRMNTNKAPGPVGRAIRDALMPGAMRLMANRKSMTMPFRHHVEPLC